jgi:hypothetical protein
MQHNRSNSTLQRLNRRLSEVVARSTAAHTGNVAVGREAGRLFAAACPQRHTLVSTLATILAELDVGIGANEAVVRNVAQIRSQGCASCCSELARQIRETFPAAQATAASGGAA